MQDAINGDALSELLHRHAIHILDGKTRGPILLAHPAHRGWNGWVAQSCHHLLLLDQAGDVSRLLHLLHSHGDAAHCDLSVCALPELLDDFAVLLAHHHHRSGHALRAVTKGHVKENCICPLLPQTSGR